MKQYLLAGLAVLFVGAHASENPFDLEENLGKVEQEQTSMLADLQKLVDAKELAEEESDDDSDLDADELEGDENEGEDETSIVEKTPVEKTPLAEKEEKSTEAPVKVVTETVVPTAPKKGLSETEVERAALLAAIKKTEDALKVAKEEQKISADKLAAQEVEKEKAAKAELVRQEESKKEATRKAAQAKAEEAREVAAYEKQRAVKIAKEKEAAKVAVEQSKIEEIEVVKTTETKQKTDAPSDINVTREYVEETEAADVIYADAVKEMSQAD